MKYESSISSSFPFNKTSVHFISERRLNLNYFDFSWPNFGKCYQTWKRRLFWASPIEIKRHSLHFCSSLWIFLSCISSECQMHIMLKSLLRLLTRPFVERENLQRNPLGFFSFIPQQTYFLMVGENRVLFSEVAFEFLCDIKNAFHKYSCYRLSSIPQNSYVEIPTLVPQNMTLFRNRIIANIIS